MLLGDQRAAGKIAVDHDLKCVVVQIGAREIPIFVVGLVKKIEAILAFHPSYLDLHVEICGIGRGMLAGIVVHAIDADGVIVGNDGPIVGVAVDARNHVRRKLKNFEDCAGATAAARLRRLRNLRCRNKPGLRRGRRLWLFRCRRRRLLRGGGDGCSQDDCGAHERGRALSNST